MFVPINYFTDLLHKSRIFDRKVNNESHENKHNHKGKEEQVPKYENKEKREKKEYEKEIETDREFEIFPFWNAVQFGQEV